MPAIVRPTLTYLAEYGVRDGSSSVTTKSLQEVTGTRKLVGLWSERISLAKYFLGTSEIEWDAGGPAGGNPVRLRRLIPLKFSESGTFSAWYATRITVDHNHKVTGATTIIGDASKAATYKKICFTVHYEKPKFYVLDDTSVDANHEYLRWTEWPKGRAQADVLAFKAGNARYRNAANTNASGKIVPYGTNRVQPLTRVSFIWRDLPPGVLSLLQGTPIPLQKRLMGDPANIDAILHIGTINSVTLGSAYPAGSLFLESWEWDVRPAPVDDPAWDLGVRYDFTYNCIHRPTPGGWNSILYADPNGANSGYYYFTRTAVTSPGPPPVWAGPYPAGGPGTAPDYESLYNCRDFRDLWKVQT